MNWCCCGWKPSQRSSVCECLSRVSVLRTQRCRRGFHTRRPGRRTSLCLSRRRRLSGVFAARRVSRSARRWQANGRGQSGGARCRLASLRWTSCLPEPARRGQPYAAWTVPKPGCCGLCRRGRLPKRGEKPMPAEKTVLMPAETVLIARPALCPRCEGRGELPALSCGFCGLFEQSAVFEKNRSRPWYSPEDIAGDCFPGCGHAIGFLSVVWGAFLCPDCGKEGYTGGQIEVCRTEAEWARQDEREARQKKQAASSAAKVLRDQGTRSGYSGRHIRRLLRLLTPLCEAHCRRTGRPCPNRVILGAMRCRLHGGLSAGATAAGRARISESNRRRKQANTDAE